MINQAQVELARNLYQLVDKELERLHELMRTFAGKETSIDPYGNRTFHGSITNDIYDRILRFHNVMLEGLKTHDVVIQEKIAEMALTETNASK